MSEHNVCCICIWPDAWQPPLRSANMEDYCLRSDLFPRSCYRAHERGVTLPPFWQLQGSTRIVRIACLEKTWRRDEQQDTENDANLLQISMSIMNNYT